MDIVAHVFGLTLAVWDQLGAIGASIGSHGAYVATDLRSWRVW